MISIPTYRSVWRDTARPFMLGPIDGRAVFPIVIFALHIRWWTFILAVSVIAVILIIGRFGYTPRIALLALRSPFTKVGRVYRLGHKRIWR